MRPNLRHQVAVVTGASRGIGRAIALRLAAAQCRVAGVARSEDGLRETAEAAAAAGSEPILTISADITDDAALQQAMQLVIERLGRITILINNAGFAPPRTTLVRHALTDFDRTLATCLRAPMVLTRLVLPDMLAHGQGTIVNIASIAAKQGRAGETAYAAAKAGLLGFTQSLHAEVHNRGVKVTAICPGYVDTDFIPQNSKVDRAKFLQAGDVADVVFDVLNSPFRVCPREIVLEPQYDPESA